MQRGRAGVASVGAYLGRSTEPTGINIRKGWGPEGAQTSAFLHVLDGWSGFAHDEWGKARAAGTPDQEVIVRAALRVPNLEERLSGLTREVATLRSLVENGNDLLSDWVGSILPLCGDIDALSDKALASIRTDGELDAIDFAEREGLDIRVAEMVFRRLLRRGQISEV